MRTCMQDLEKRPQRRRNGRPKGSRDRAPRRPRKRCNDTDENSSTSDDNPGSVEKSVHDGSTEAADSSVLAGIIPHSGTALKHPSALRSSTMAAESTDFLTNLPAQRSGNSQTSPLTPLAMAWPQQSSSRHWSSLPGIAMALLPPPNPPSLLHVEYGNAAAVARSPTAGGALPHSLFSTYGGGGGGGGGGEGRGGGGGWASAAIPTLTVAPAAPPPLATVYPVQNQAAAAATAALLWHGLQQQHSQPPSALPMWPSLPLPQLLPQPPQALPMWPPALHQQQPQPQVLPMWPPLLSGPGLVAPPQPPPPAPLHMGLPDCGPFPPWSGRGNLGGAGSGGF
jgi:hypothetical protein